MAPIFWAIDSIVGADDDTAAIERRPGNATDAIKTLVLDVGGTHVKMLAAGHRVPRKFESGPTMGPDSMVRQVKKLTADWKYDHVSIGYPGPVLHGRPVAQPHNLGEGWVGFDFQGAFGCPVRIINDAAMQALGCYHNGRMLFLGLGTGLGSAMIVDGKIEPLELGHLPYKKGRTYEDYVGVRALEHNGLKKWRKSVADVVKKLKEALEVDELVVGGGNAKRLKSPPAGARIVDNRTALVGGFRLWDPAAEPVIEDR
jgi:polyphosphate glucokinase